MRQLSRAQEQTLNTIIANGGAANSFAGQPGIYCNSLPALVRLGMLERLGSCPCWRGQACDREHGMVSGRGGDVMYARVRVTSAGRDHIAHTARRCDAQTDEQPGAGPEVTP